MDVLRGLVLWLFGLVFVEKVLIEFVLTGVGVSTPMTPYEK